jgi:hypothetical protein
MHGDVALFVDDGLEGRDLQACGEDGLKVFHGEGPTEGLLLEELVERFGLLEELGIVRLLHEGLIALTLVVERGDLVVEDAFAGAGLFSLVVEGVKAEAERDGNHGEDGECDAQSANGRAGIGEWAGGEIEGYANAPP